MEWNCVHEEEFAAKRVDKSYTNFDTPIITTRVVRDTEVNLLPWSARSPDLSSTEHVWDMRDRIFGQLPV